jgi:hypothetical protein
MKTRRIITLGAATAMVVACTPADGPPNAVVADTEETNAPVVPPPTAQATTLEEVAGSGVTGEVQAVPHEAATEIAVMVRNAPPHAVLGVRVQTGSCRTPGRELAAIDPIRTDAMGQGEIRTTVGQAPQLLMDGSRLIAVYAPGAQPGQDQPIACTRIPLQDDPVAAPESESDPGQPGS